MISSSSSESESVPSEGLAGTYSKSEGDVRRLRLQINSLRDQLQKAQRESNAAIAEEKQMQLEIGGLKAELDKERGSREEMVAAQVHTKLRFSKQEITDEWAKSEAAWKERIRNERLLRLSYERVLLGLGFAPSRIASDLVRVSRPQPLHEDPSTYGTMSLLDMEAGLSCQPQSIRKGLYAYNMTQLKVSALPPQVALTEDVPEFCLSLGKGRRDLLKSLSTSA